MIISHCQTILTHSFNESNNWKISKAYTEGYRTVKTKQSKTKTLRPFNRKDSFFLSNQRPDEDKTQNLFSRQITLKAQKNLFLQFFLRVDQ